MSKLYENNCSLVSPLHLQYITGLVLCSSRFYPLEGSASKQSTGNLSHFSYDREIFFSESWIFTA